MFIIVSDGDFMSFADTKEDVHCLLDKFTKEGHNPTQYEVFIRKNFTYLPPISKFVID